ncbi:hypothetical protein L596_014741 [Steinernema carpocapsae]|uniref:Uncharacterized protein n=1 Tax=Steinernema carpocapsae TaxID=34508 RepID=A0A4U5NDB8_STECR|nr:hypothetical protein L596_014741 [Steinernema carpocapsae]
MISLKKSTDSLNHAKTHGDIEIKREVERSGEDPFGKQIKLDFAEDSTSRNEKILRFFAAFGLRFKPPNRTNSLR